jgi:hypothetical protein
MIRSPRDQQAADDRWYEADLAMEREERQLLLHDFALDEFMALRVQHHNQPSLFDEIALCDEPDLCTACNGTGENVNGAKCPSCRGYGVRFGV